MKVGLATRRVLRRSLVVLLGVPVLLTLCGCTKTVGVRTLGISVTVPDAFSQVYASSAPITLTATLEDDPTNQGVTWTLSLANTMCSPGCGTLKKSDMDPKFSIVYTPPAVPPQNTTATITARSGADNSAVFTFNFTILPAISVTIVNKFTTQKSDDPPVAVNATVSNDVASAGVTWTLTVNGQPCPASACGTLVAPQSPTLTATYTPPVNPPGGANASPTITATSVTDPTKSDSFTFMIVPGIVVTITNKFSTAAVGGLPVVVNATVTGDPSNAGVTWTMLNANGQPCPADCGTLVAAPAPTFTATYTPPANQPTGADSHPEIIAVSVANTTKLDDFSFAISVGCNKFVGSYALLLRGFYDQSSAGQPNVPMAVGGSFTADGLCNITGGDLDFNNGSGITSASGVMGNYAVDSSFNGIIRGTINITNLTFTGAAAPFPLSFRFVLSADLKHGRVVEFDGASFINTGTLELQDPTALTAANPAGTYAFGVDSDAPIGGRTVEAGQLILSSTAVTVGVVDASKAGDASPRYAQTPLASSAITAPDSNGRGTLTLNIVANGAVPGSADKYAYYIVNSGQLNLIQIDQAPAFGTVFAGVARAQQALTASSLNTTSVIQLTGMDAVPGTSNQVGPDVIIGVMTIPNPLGGTPATFTLTFDENDLGNVFSSKITAGDIANFNPTTGRGQFSDTGGFGVGFMDSAVFYLYDAGRGFIIDADPSTCVPGGVCPPPNNYPITNNAFSGTLTPQTLPFGNQSLSGNFILSSGASAIADIPSAAVAMTADTSGSPPTLTGIGDISSLTVQVGNNFADVSIDGTFTLEDTTLGHGLIRLPQQLFGNFSSNQLFVGFFYLLGPNQFVAIGTQQGTDSGVIFGDPQ